MLFYKNDLIIVIRDIKVQAIKSIIKFKGDCYLI